MRAGRLRDRVTIERQVIGSPPATAIGEPDAAWATYATVWAQIQPTLARERMAAEQLQSSVDVKIRFRYMTGVTDGLTAAMRIVQGSKVYDIVGQPINVDNANAEWLCLCSTGANQG